MPYQPNPVFDKIQFDKKLWRYVGFSKFMWILHTQQLHFHRVGAFSDPFEGTIPRSIRELQTGGMDPQSLESGRVKRLYQRLQNDLSKSRKIAKKSLFANCWNMKDFESAAMWELYGDADKTIAIETTVGDLVNAISETEEEIHIGKMKYVDFTSSLSNLSSDDLEKLRRLSVGESSYSMYLPSTLKRKEFEHEEEVRAVLEKSFEGENPPAGINVPIDVESLINQIWIAPFTNSWYSKAVKEATVAVDDLDINGDRIQNSDLESEPVI